MGNRGRFEFSNEVKNAAKKKWHEENPGNRRTPLEVDHIIAIWFAKKYGIPAELIRTRENARALTPKEHKEKHRNEPTEEEYKTLAQAILGFIGNLF